MASTPPEQRVSHHYQHHGLGQRSAQATPCDSREQNVTQCLNQCLSPSVHRIWISAPGGHDPLLPSVACHPAGSQWHHPMSRPHPRVSADSPRVSDAPTCSDSSGGVYREPHPPQKLHSSDRTVNIPGSGTTGKCVSFPPSACVVFNSQFWSFLHHLCLAGNTSAVMSTESWHCWPTWASCSLLTLDQLDLWTASHRTR